MATTLSKKPLTNPELSAFCEQMSLILKSGISSVEGVHILLCAHEGGEEVGRGYVNLHGGGIAVDCDLAQLVVHALERRRADLIDGLAHGAKACEALIGQKRVPIVVGKRLAGSKRVDRRGGRLAHRSILVCTAAGQRRCRCKRQRKQAQE